MFDAIASPRAPNGRPQRSLAAGAPDGPEHQQAETAAAQRVPRSGAPAGAKCIVTPEGTVHGCRVLQGLPFMDRAVIEALEQRRYLPARLSDGRPLEVDYTFRVRLQLPQ
jgi:protein TonB